MSVLKPRKKKDYSRNTHVFIAEIQCGEEVDDGFWYKVLAKDLEDAKLKVNTHKRCNEFVLRLYPYSEVTQHFFKRNKCYDLKVV